MLDLGSLGCRQCHSGVPRSQVCCMKNMMNHKAVKYAEKVHREGINCYTEANGSIRREGLPI